MADAVLSAAVERMFGLIEEQAVYHVNLVRGAEEEVCSLADELNTIRNVLDDAENRRFQDKSINTWLWKLRQVSYDMDDVLDEWKYALLKLQKEKPPPKQKVCSFIPSSSSSCLCFKKAAVRHEIAQKIVLVKKRLDEILEEKKGFGFKISEPIAEPLPGSHRDQSTSFDYLGEVHGRDADGDNLVNQLLLGNGDIQVVSIVGMGGLGKTTLAQLVYNHCRIKESFDLRIWICVSDPFDLSAIAKGILERIEKGSSQGADQLDVLFTRVEKLISEKKFLLVLDDVWTKEYKKWGPLENLLKCGGADSKILVTTRNREVAAMMGTRDSEIFELALLSDEECWLVLCHMARLERSRAEFEVIGKKIAQKCRGLPLAAKTLGSLLRFKSSLREWGNVLNSEILGMQKAEDELFPPLLMSYKELTPTQKQCFSYCAVYPKDSSIEVETLIQNWMALGYLGSNSVDMELKGKECFDVLAMRSLFQDFEKGEWGEIVWCKMHDIVHDFALFLRKSGRAEINKSKPCGACDPLQVSNVNEFCTLYCNAQSPQNLCTCFIRLRVLSLGKCWLPMIPRGIGNLIHLRSLDLSGSALSSEDLRIIFQLCFLLTLKLSYCGLEVISNEIENLSELRHLELSSNELKELPSEIGNLKQLRHLNLSGNDSIKELPSEIGELILLQTFHLPYPEDGWRKLGLLKKLNQLGGDISLSIHLDGKDVKGIAKDAEEAELCNKTLIQELILSFEDEMDEEESEAESSRMDVMDALAPHPNLTNLSITGYNGCKLPVWIVSPHNQLSKINLIFCRITSLPSFGQLPCLQELLISVSFSLEFVGREFLGITNFNVAFPKLRKLIFEGCHMWKEWEDITAEEEEEEDEAFQVMPCLTNLEILMCSEMSVLPHRLLRKASSLQIFSLTGSKKLLQNYGNKEGSQYWKSISLNNPNLLLQH